MKKFNLSDIMKTAWEILRNTGCTMSEALKASWKKAKEMVNKIVAIIGTERKIETVYREARSCYSGRFDDEVLEATEDGEGNITLGYASGGTYEKASKTSRVNQVVFTLAGGAINGELFGIDLNLAKSFAGKTYSVRQALKTAGYSWDKQSKTWVK
mgnify:CR=1 FL=1